MSGAGVLFPQARRVAELAAKHRLPAMYELRAYVEAGGLIAYGPDIIDIWRRAAGYVDKILKGARPADLPVEQPTKFELVVNLKTAKALSFAKTPSGHEGRRVRLGGLVARKPERIAPCRLRSRRENPVRTEARVEQRPLHRAAASPHNVG